LRSPRYYVYLSIFIFPLLLAGCGGPLRYAYTPTRQDSPIENTEHISLYIAPVEDERQDIASGKGNKIGDIRSTVLDIYGTELVLSRNPAQIIREALIKEFRGAGFEVLSEAQDKADYVLKAKLEKFHLDVTSKDSIAIALFIELLNTHSRKNLWAGQVKSSDSRYAGVSGDSRRSISKYISISMATVLKKALHETEAAIKRDIPAISTAIKNSNEGTTQGREGINAKGLLRLTTEPLRAKIYLNNIYYGLSPQNLRLRTGIYDLLIRKDGFIDFREKIAVDKERETEVDEKLHKSTTE